MDALFGFVLSAWLLLNCLTRAEVPSITLNNGYKIPAFGFGTYLSKPGDVGQAVKDAIDAGYRHIDAAYVYENEKEVGNAIRAKIANGTVTREELFITTKLWNTYHKEERVVPALRKSLANLSLDYVDLYLVHWPFAFKESDELRPADKDGKIIFDDVDYLETWKGMEECVRLNLTRSIGISNFNSEQITRLLGAANIKPVVNQVEVNVNFNQEPLREFCQKHNITIVAYSPLGRPGNKHGIKNGLDNQKILDIAKKYNKTAAQIALRYLVQLGTVPIPKSVTKSRIVENISIFDFELTSEEMETIKSLNTGTRIGLFPDAKDDKYYPFNIPF